MSHRNDSCSTIGHLLEGVVRFREEVFPPSEALFAGLARGQSPRILFITCADSRLSPELITQTKPGDMFVLRNVGNIVPPHGAADSGAAAAVEYAVSVLGVTDVVVCGHTDCGAIKALADPHATALDALPMVKAWLGNAGATRRTTASPSPAGELRVLIERNVLQQLAHLRTHPAVATRLAQNGLSLHGWVYDIGHGTVDVLDQDTGSPIDAADALARLAVP